MRMEGKKVIVTGAGKGIGAGIAVEFAREGADVLVNYAHSAEGARRVAGDIEALGRRALLHQADVSSREQVEAMVEAAYAEFGRIDVLVNNSGVSKFLDFFAMSEEDWDQVVDTNLKGTFLCSQAVAKRMRQDGGGAIVNIGSVHSHATIAEFTPYAASKGGIDGLTRTMALSLAPHNIRVNTIAPGLIEIERIRDDPLYDREQRATQIPVGRVGYPKDIAQVAIFFASEDSSFVTGQVLVVDGGQICKLAMKRGKD